MKIRQIGKYDGDIIATILENRKVEDIGLFLNPTEDDDLDAFKLANMREGVHVTLAHVSIMNHIGILIDPDADGFSSSSIIYQTLKAINPDLQISYFLHDGKAHGLTEKILEKVSGSSIDLIIIPDAGSNDDEQISRLYAMGIDVVIIDHHEVDSPPQVGILINNQLDDNEETNRNLVGAGMALKFCKAIESMLNINVSNDLYDLVAVGQIGDGSDISQNEVRNMVFKGLEEIKNPFIKVVLEDSFDDLSKIAPINLSFSIIPLINAVVRVGTDEEKDLLFRALNSINGDETFLVTKRKKNKTTGKFDKFEVTQSLYEYAYDVCKKVKGRQAGLVKKIMASLEKDIILDGGVAIGIVPTSDQGSITGLVANKIASKYQKPTLLVHYVKEKDAKTGMYMGSGRGHEKTLPSLREWCNSTGLTEYAQGHANAFGIGIPEENFEEFKKRTLNVQPSDFVYDVDLHQVGKIDVQAILDVNENKRLFGGKVSEPLLAFTQVKVRKDFIRQRGSMLTFFESGVELVMFGAPEGLHESLTHNFDQYIPMDFVGRPSENNWGGRITPRIVLEDCERSIVEVAVEEKIEDEITAETIVF